MDYHREDAQSISSLAGLITFALPFIILWGEKDRNNSGDFTISDVYLYIGESFSLPYRIAYELFSELFYFFEIYPPVEPNYTTSVLGLILLTVSSFVTSLIAVGLTGVAFDFWSHWKKTDIQ